MRQLTSATSEPAIQQNEPVIAERVRAEFREMPGLTLTLAQARRLWGLDLRTCSEVLSQLSETGFLSRRADGAFCRASDLAALDQPRRTAQA